MRIIASICLILGLALYVQCKVVEENFEEQTDNAHILECMFQDNAGNCLRTRLARDIDQIEYEVTGKRSKPPMSSVLEQAGSVIAEIVDDLRESGTEGIIEEDDAQENHQEEARKKKLKKKKKHLHKLLGLAMLLKAKIGLLLQMISTHFQLKFFVIALISLLLNAARFWIEIKKGSPSKVIYYEHAQHQHHYDHDEHDHGYWGRSSNETPQDLPYRGYTHYD